MIHLINPWGTAWSRRVNEDNVDLNRNFVDWKRAVPRNERYAPLHNAFVCAEWDGPDRDRADQLLRCQGRFKRPRRDRRDYRSRPIRLSRRTVLWRQRPDMVEPHPQRYLEHFRQWRVGCRRLRSSHRCRPLRISRTAIGGGRGPCRSGMGQENLWARTRGRDDRQWRNDRYRHCGNGYGLRFSSGLQILAGQPRIAAGNRMRNPLKARW